MANVTAAQVKELRERTGAGMMDCKKALLAGGSMENAVEELRKQGIIKAGNKASRIAAEGVIAIEQNDNQAILLEINCETDFVARDTNFLNFVNAITKAALEAQIADVDALSNLTLSSHEGKTVEQVRQELVAKIGENVQLRRAVLSNPQAAIVGTYRHGHRIGVMVELDMPNLELARDIAMHIVASKPMVISPNDVSEDIIAKEKEIYLAQASASGKPQDIIEKMVAGRLKKYLDEVSLVGQPFVKDPDMTVGGLLNKFRAKVLGFYRFEVGEGIEKTKEDFKEAVMSQIQGG